MCCSNRKCACRRELNCHEAAKPQTPTRRHAAERERRQRRRQDAASRFGKAYQSPDERRRRSTQRERFPCRQEVKAKTSALRSALQGAKRHAKFLAGAADAEYRDCSCCGAERRAESLPCKYTLARLPRELMPNPSFKPSPNGGPPGPVWRYAVHFRQPGPGVPPSVPA